MMCAMGSPDRRDRRCLKEHAATITPGLVHKFIPLLLCVSSHRKEFLP